MKSIRNIESSVQPSRDRTYSSVFLDQLRFLIQIQQVNKRSQIKLPSSSTKSQTLHELLSSSKSLFVLKQNRSLLRRSFPTSHARSSSQPSPTNLTRCVSTARSLLSSPATANTCWTWWTTPQSPRARPETPTTDMRQAKRRSMQIGKYRNTLANTATASSKTVRTPSPTGLSRMQSSHRNCLLDLEPCRSEGRPKLPGRELIWPVRILPANPECGCLPANTVQEDQPSMRTKTRRVRKAKPHKGAAARK